MPAWLPWRSVSVVLARTVVCAFSAAVAVSACNAVSVTPRFQTGRTTPSRETRTNRLGAVSVAGRMLRQVVLPAGSRRIAAAPSALRKVLARPYESFWIASQVDRPAFWMTSAQFGAAIASIEAHIPKDAKRLGYEWQPGVNASATYALPTIDRGSLGARQLVIEAFGRVGGGSIVRADAEVRYIAPRPYDERIPPQARELEVTVGSNLSRPLLARTVTQVAEVHRIGRMVDSLPFVGNESGVTFSCPAQLGTLPVDRFVFRAAPGGPALATVTELADQPSSDDPCRYTSLTIRGRHEPPLQDGGILLREAAALLNARLVCTINIVRTKGRPGHRATPEVQCKV